MDNKLLCNHQLVVLGLLVERDNGVGVGLVVHKRVRRLWQDTCRAAAWLTPRIKSLWNVIICLESSQLHCHNDAQDSRTLRCNVVCSATWRYDNKTVSVEWKQVEETREKRHELLYSFLKVLLLSPPMERSELQEIMRLVDLSVVVCARIGGDMHSNERF